MLENSFRRAIGKLSRWQIVLLLPAWVLLGFIVAQFSVVWFLRLLLILGVPLDVLSGTVMTAVQAALVYVVALSFVVGIPWRLQRRMPTLQSIGLQRLLSWKDLGFSIVAYLTYLLVVGIVFILLKSVPWFDANQPQEIGFDQLGMPYEYLIAFVTLVIIAPVAEEMLFRGYLYGRLRKWVPFWVAALATSILFGVIHGSWNVGIDTFLLSMFLCSLREVTGSIWAGIVVHMIKNGLAFYLIFISQALNGIM